MTVLEETEIQLQWSDLDSLVTHQWPDPVRSPGVHVSSIIRHIATKSGLYTFEAQQDDMGLRVLIGMGWEAMCVRLYEQVLWQPGELECDEVYLSPDGLGRSGDNDDWCIDEFKYTGLSRRVKGGKEKQHKRITDMLMWMWQVMSYCYAMERTYEVPVRYARLHVCWSRGDYSYPQVEQYVRYLVRFEEEELQRNWNMLMENKEEVWV